MARRRAAFVVLAIVAAAIALIPVRSVLLGPSPAFLGAYGALMVCTEVLTAVMLASRARSTRDRCVGTLAAAYTFSALLIVGNVISLPSVSGVHFARQTAPWMWILWHTGWGLILNLFAWDGVPARLATRWRLAAALAASLGCVALAVFAANRMPVLLEANGSWTGALWTWYDIAFAVDVLALAGFARRVRTLTPLELWAFIAVIAASIEVAFTTLSLVRFSVGFYAGRTFSLISGMAVFASLTFDFIALVRRRAAEERESEFRALGETIPLIMFTAAPDGAIEWYNEEWFAYTGQTRAEAAGWGWQAVHHPDDFQAVMRRWPETIASGAPFEMEFRLRGRDGTFRWFLSRVRPYRDPSGRIMRWFGTTTDIDDQKRETERSQRIAHTLQEVFLPERLPQRDDVAFDAIYVPAEHDALIGGDWYDCVTLPDGRLLLSIGDVAGHGLAAAVDGGRLRQTIVSEALDDDDPSTILRKADRLMRLQTETIATALVAFYDPADATLTYASAGHPTPILGVPGERARVLPNGGAPLGTGFADPAHEARTHAVHVPADALVAFYTDGVIEVDRDVIAGEERLLEAVRRAATGGGAPSAAALLRDALGARPPADDVAVLVMQRCDALAAARADEAPPGATWRFHSSSAYTARDARVVLMRYVREHAAPGADLFAAELILGELIANTVEHAPGLVEVAIDWSGRRPVVRVRDAGPGMDAAGAYALPADPYSDGGRGLFLVATLGADVRVGRAPGFGTEISVQLPVVRSIVTAPDVRDLPAIEVHAG